MTKPEIYMKHNNFGKHLNPGSCVVSCTMTVSTLCCSDVVDLSFVTRRTKQLRTPACQNSAWGVPLVTPKFDPRYVSLSCVNLLSSPLF